MSEIEPSALLGQQTTFFVGEEGVGKRLDYLLATRFPNFSRTYFQELIGQGCVLVSGAICKKREKLKADDEIDVLFALRPGPSLEPEAIPLDILYEDAHLIAINKPVGMVVHPAPGHPSHTFVNALLHHCTLSHTDPLRPGIVHRLDKETSGVLLAAKTQEAHSALVALFAKRKIEKTYLAILYGSIADGLIDLPIGRHCQDRKKMGVVPEGKEAKTLCQTLKKEGDLSYVKISLLTGRTHQIRVHCAHLKAPVLGDALYGSSTANLRYGAKRQLLHAQSLRFQHPFRGDLVEISAPIPSDFPTWAIGYS